MAKSKSTSASKGTKKRQRVSSHSVSTSSKSRLKDDPIGPSDSDSHPAIYRYQLTDGDLAKALVRENVLDFFYPHVLHGEKKQKSEAKLERLQQRRDVFLLAFQAVQQLASTDKWSFYQMAGIHGLPYQAYDGDEGSWDASAGSSWWGGYCEHGSPLFPTWHRPYMLLMEQSIIRQAKLLATSATDSTEKALVKEIADELRVPYWDWANDYTRIFGVPDVFTSTEISLLYTWKSFSTTPIPNPLKSFVFPVDVGVPFSSSDVFNPAAKPHYVVPPSGSTPYSPKGYPTVRHVSAAYTSQNDQLNLTVMRNAGTTLIEGVFAAFHHSDWLSFSNHFWSESTHGDGSEFGHYSSLELVHDLLHSSVGGSGGQMTYPDTAAFDPIFFFHHANVDRLVALWQYCYPKSWIDDKVQDIDDGTYTIKPDTPAASDTDLTPFRRSQAKNAFVSSNDVRIVDIDCGYTYPEIQMARKHQWTPGKMLRDVLELYKPPQHYVHNWFLVLEKIIKRAFNGPYSIRVFIDKADATAATSVSNPHFAGDIHVFARSNTVRCVNCDLHQNMRASLNLTKTMVRLGMTTAIEMNNAGDAPAPNINPLAAANAITLVFVDPRGDQLKPSSIGWDGPNRYVYYQEGVKDEDMEEVLLQQVDEDSNPQLPMKPPTKFLLTN